MERDIILIGGMPGSGKSRLGKSIADELRTEMSIEHLPIGDIIRAIGRGAIESFYASEIRQHLMGPNASELIDNTVMYAVIDETLTAHAHTDHLMIDGYPRTLDQLDDLAELASNDARTQVGAIVTVTNEDTAVMRMIKRSPRDYEGALTVDWARTRIQRHIDNYTPVITTLHSRDTPITFVDTSGIKADTNLTGLKAIKTIIHQNRLNHPDIA
ncbi:MAG: adk [Candidatus Saccharibacteria bacterium]|jgi:adenylate kinase|nr:adk [Candidatus Saccharibacteria bacterium]